MRKLFFILSIILLFGCSNDNKTTETNENNKVQALLEKKINAITPGLGEYMSMIEYHHINLQQSANDKNLERASYECDELMEVFEKIELLHNKHEKLKSTATAQLQTFMYPTIKIIQENIKQNDLLKMQQNVKILTLNCNSCHKANDMTFIKVLDK